MPKQLSSIPPLSERIGELTADAGYLKRPLAERVADAVVGGVKEEGKQLWNGTKYGLDVWRKTGQELLKSPIRVASSLIDVPRTIAGKDPLEAFMVPGLGEVKTFARQAVDDAPTMGAFPAALKAGSQGILETAGLGAMAQSLMKAPVTAENFKAGDTLYRGESGANEGGLHFTTDKKWAENFGDRMYEGTLPKNAKIYHLTPDDLQQALDDGITNERQLWDRIFRKGYDAIVGSDAMRAGEPDIIVSPALRGQFSSPATEKLVGDVIAPHLQSSKMVLTQMTPEEIAAHGGVPELIKHTQTNIADSLAGEHLTRAAEAVRKIPLNGLKTLDDLAKAISGNLALKGALGVGFVGMDNERLKQALSSLGDKMKQKLSEGAFTVSEELAKAGEKVTAPLVQPIIDKAGEGLDAIRRAIPGGMDPATDTRGIIDKLTGTQRYDRSRELAKQRLPFTDETLNIVDNIPIEKDGVDKEKAGGEYTSSRGPLSNFFANLLAPAVSPLAPDVVAKIRGEHANVRSNNGFDALVAGHELLHGIFSRRNIDVGEFDKAWEEAKKNDNDKVLEYIDKTLSNKDEGLYKNLDPYDRANERFAYLGSMNGVNGLASIPPEMRKFYDGVLKEDAGRYLVDDIELKKDDLDELRKVLYGEISKRGEDKQKLEARVIINTALNRMAQYNDRDEPKTLREVLSMPNQYQAYGGKQYKLVDEGKADPEKLKAIDAILEELKTGNFPDNTDGAVYYVHNKDGSITYDNSKRLFADKKK